jgi:flagella basal body P-ring formation protein FlgA
MTPLAALAVAGCLAIDPGSDRILLRDLSPAFASTAEMPLDSVISFAPAPGLQRRFGLAELARIAARLKLPAPEREVCVERPVAPISPERILQTMRAAVPDARIELLDYSRRPVPEGVLEFPPGGLREAASAGYWAGFVRYGGQNRMPVWARVKIAVSGAAVVAVADLPPGRPVDPASVKLESVDRFPSSDSVAVSLDEVAGRLPRSLIRSGSPVRVSMLDIPKAVTRGEAVQVEVRDGAAMIQLSGQAEASGAVGDTIPVRNPTSNKRFTARIAGKGRVVVGEASK